MACYENEIFRITKHGGHVANDESDVDLNDISQVCTCCICIECMNQLCTLSVSQVCMMCDHFRQSAEWTFALDNLNLG